MALVRGLEALPKGVPGGGGEPGLNTPLTFLPAPSSAGAGIHRTYQIPKAEERS